MSCVVPKCGRRIRARPDGVSFHLFPSEKDKRQQWKEAIGLPNVSLQRRDCICSVHFPENQILSIGKKRVLIANALPDRNIKFSPMLKTPDQYGLISDEEEAGPSRRQKRKNLGISLSNEPIISHEERGSGEKGTPLRPEDDPYQAKTSYLIPFKYISPNPIWHMRSYTPGEKKVKAIPFTSVISRSTQTENADYGPIVIEKPVTPIEPEKPVEKQPEPPKEDPITINRKRREANMSVAFQKAQHKAAKLKRLIRRKDKGIKYLLGSLDRAEQRVEGLAKLIEDLTPMCNDGKKPRKKRKPWKTAKNSSTASHNQMNGDVRQEIVANIALPSLPTIDDVQLTMGVPSAEMNYANTNGVA